MNFQASKLGHRLEMAGLGRFFRDLWTLARFMTKVCFWLSILFALLSLYYFNYFQIRHLEDSFDQETAAARKKLYNESIKKWKAAARKINQTRKYFTSDDWRDW